MYTYDEYLALSTQMYAALSQGNRLPVSHFWDSGVDLETFVKTMQTYERTEEALANFNSAKTLLKYVVNDIRSASPNNEAFMAILNNAFPSSILRDGVSSLDLDALGNMPFAYNAEPRLLTEERAAEIRGGVPDDPDAKPKAEENNA